LVPENALLLSSGQDSDAEWFREIKLVTRPSQIIRPDSGRMDQPSNRQSENRLRRIDAVASGKRDPRSRPGISSASQHVSGDCSVELIHRPAQDRYSQNRLSTHRVDVTDRIHGSDRTEVKWIVHD